MKWRRCNHSAFRRPRSVFEQFYNTSRVSEAPNLRVFQAQAVRLYTAVCVAIAAESRRRTAASPISRFRNRSEKGLVTFRDARFSNSIVPSTSLKFRHLGYSGTQFWANRATGFSSLQHTMRESERIGLAILVEHSG